MVESGFRSKMEWNAMDPRVVHTWYIDSSDTVAMILRVAARKRFW